MEGNQSQNTTAYCRYCPKQFRSLEELALHERNHVAPPGQMIPGAGPSRPYYERPQAIQNSGGPQSGPLESFPNLVHQFRSSVANMDIESQLSNPGGNLLAAGAQNHRNNIQRTVPQTTQPDSLSTNQGQTDIRNSFPSSPADVRNLVASSPVDVRNMVPSSPGDIRNMMASSPADQRNFAASSPAESRNMVPSSPIDSRNIAHSPAMDQRSLVASSPIDQRNMMVSSPPDARMLAPVNHPDQKALVRGRSMDNQHVSQLLEQRSRMLSSPVDQRNIMPGSPADPRMMNTVHMEHRSLGSPGMIPHTTVATSSQLEAKEADRRRIQSIVEDIRTLDSRSSSEPKSFLPPNTMYRYF